MAEISFKKFPQKKITVDVPANLMKALLDAQVPVASSCGGDGVCGKCKIEIISGVDHLSSPNETEIFLREKNNLPSGVRISCQTWVEGDVEVDAGYW